MFCDLSYGPIKSWGCATRTLFAFMWWLRPMGCVLCEDLQCLFANSNLCTQSSEVLWLFCWYNSVCCNIS